MGFRQDDIYVQGGVNKIAHFWNPGVEKFDTSSFYNWEQDNLPLYDLEERTYYLWEKAGWPTSGNPQVSGVIFSVSADAVGTDEYLNNSNLFLDLSSAVDALPDVIRYPVRIEVANFGYLGQLVLENIQFAGSGALEIVNRNFTPFQPGGEGGVGTNLSSIATVSVTGTAAGSNNGYSRPCISRVSSVDASNVLTNTSALGVSSKVMSYTGLESRWNNKGIVLAQGVHSTNNNNYMQKTDQLSVGMYPAAPLLNPATATNQFDFTPYGDANEAGIASYDFSACHNGVTDYANYRKWVDAGAISWQDEVPVVGGFYGNWLDKIKITNCGGPLYIRNFAVDGALGDTTPTLHTTKHGININNSEVVLEYCAALRCYESGFNLVNSNVILSRGAWAWRNYALTGAAARDDTVNSAGFNLVNSNITLSSVAAYSFYGAGAPFVSTRNRNGIIMHNSTIRGGDKRTNGNDPRTMTSLQVFENSKVGIDMLGSKIDLNGALDVFMHPNGIDANNSLVAVDELYVDNTDHIGVHLKNSELVYSKNANFDLSGVAANGNDIVEKTMYPANQVANPNMTAAGFWSAQNGYDAWAEDPGMSHFDTNGQHLVLDNSKVSHPRLYQTWGISRLKFKRNHGALTQTDGSTYKKLSIPGIMCSNNSELNLTYARMQTQSDVAFGQGGDTAYLPTAGTAGGTANANFGSMLTIKNNSTVNLVGGGSNNFTFVDGPDNYVQQIYNAGVYADKNSTLNVQGPTYMSRFGVDVLVNNNSQLNMSPPKDAQGFIDTNQWSLSAAANHTKVDLHSSRSCLVATNNSVINMENLGDYHSSWQKGDADLQAGDANSWFASGLYTSANYNTAETSAFHSGGSVQFYPNPQLAGGSYGSDTVPYDPPLYLRNMSDVQTLPLQTAQTGGGSVLSNGVSSLSRGGMCVRALKGSRVHVKNVNFPCGWLNTSSIYYNFAGSAADPNGCEQLRIWNIDGTSELDMSFISVSSSFPPLTGYTGPSAVYNDAVTGKAARGAPDDTYFTSTLSVLDGFGVSGEVANGGVGPQNTGPFRIYTAPKRYAKFLVYKDQLTDETGTIYQTVAQGYNMSGPCSSIDTYHGELAKPYSMGPGYDGIYGVGPTAPSGIQGDLTISSTSATAWFAESKYGMARDRRNYTSAVACLVTPIHLAATDPRHDDIDEWGAENQSTDAFPPQAEWGTQFPNAAGAGALNYFYAKPYLKHYKHADFFYSKDLVPEGYETRIRLDESAMNTFANAKNGTLGISGRPKICSVKICTTTGAGEGAESANTTAGKGFLSASEFDLEKID